MRWKARPLREESRGDWHSWFAWFPVLIGERERCWLQTIERKGTRKSALPNAQYWWSYQYRVHDSDEPWPLEKMAPPPPVDD